MDRHTGPGPLRIAIAVVLAAIAIVLAFKILIWSLKIGVIAAVGIGIYLLLRNASAEDP